MKDTKSNLKFTVIIPTRERADTLEWSLKTCTTQDYDNFEIIVSDNFSQDHTREIVEANKDNRIRYINTGKRISMTSNYEFALSYATGDYVCIIGDDDGIMPNALHELNKVLLGTEIEAISWKKPVYIWNQHYKSELKNTLQISLKSNFRKYDSKETVKELLAFKPGAKLNYNDLACLYHGFIRRDTINKLRLPDGRFFNSTLPDVYASVAVSCAVESFYQTDVPYSLHGISKHSTGHFSEKSQSLQKFLSEIDIPPHPNIKIVPISAALCTAECFLKVQDNFPEAKEFELDIKAMAERAMEDAVELTADNYQIVADAVRYTCEVYGIQEHANRVIAQNPNSPSTSLVILGYNFYSDFLVLKFNENVKNVYDATLVYKKLVEKKLFEFYILESGRFLVSFIKNYGIRNSISKGIRRISDKLSFGSQDRISKSTDV
jgi:glycosyltransferase involved in cell wall biosynthesis